MKETLLLRFPPAGLNQTPPAGRNNGRLEGTDLQADVAEDILNTPVSDMSLGFHWSPSSLIVCVSGLRGCNAAAGI